MITIPEILLKVIGKKKEDITYINEKNNKMKNWWK